MTDKFKFVARSFPFSFILSVKLLGFDTILCLGLVALCGVGKRKLHMYVNSMKGGSIFHSRNQRQNFFVYTIF